MRCDQMVGLTPAAEHFLFGELPSNPRKKIVETFLDEKGKRTVEKYLAADDSVLLTVTDTDRWIDGMYDFPFYQLRRYEFPDGKVWEESVQCSPWSSGPMHFLNLVNVKDDGRVIPESVWPEEAIDNYI